MTIIIIMIAIIIIIIMMIIIAIITTIIITTIIITIIITQSQISSTMRPLFSTKFHFKWTSHGKLVLKRCLEAKDRFRDKGGFQDKILFQMDF